MEKLAASEEWTLGKLREIAETVAAETMDKRSPRLDVLKLDDLHHVAVHFKGQAVFEIACGYHKKFLHYLVFMCFYALFYTKPRG